MKFKITNHKHAGTHYLVIVRDPEDTESLSEEEIQHLIEVVSEDLGGVPVEFVGYEAGTEDE